LWLVGHVSAAADACLSRHKSQTGSAAQYV
jgi:hypothetical protein